MKYLILSICLLFVIPITKAQPAGYLGKRFSLSYEQLAGPNFLNLVGITNISSNNGVEAIVSESNANWNYIGALSLDYVLEKTKSRGLSISYIDQTMFFEDYNNDTVYEWGSPYLRSTYFLNNAKITGFTIGTYVKYFKKQCVAPLGEYYKFEFLYSNYHIKSINRKAEIYKLTESKIPSYSTLGLSVTYGKNRIFWDKIIVSAGVTIGLRLGFLTSGFFHDGFGPDAVALHTLKNSAQFWHGQNLLYNLHLGVGWLLF